jgi:hypothetical protein
MIVSTLRTKLYALQCNTRYVYELHGPEALLTLLCAPRCVDVDRYGTFCVRLRLRLPTQTGNISRCPVKSAANTDKPKATGNVAALILGRRASEGPQVVPKKSTSGPEPQKEESRHGGRH